MNQIRFGHDILVHVNEGKQWQRNLDKSKTKVEAKSINRY